MRRLGTAQALRAILVPKPAPWVDGLLLSALALACGTELPNTPGRPDRGGRKRKVCQASGLVNAVLRRFLRERQALMAEIESDPVAHFNHPQTGGSADSGTIGLSNGKRICRPTGEAARWRGRVMRAAPHPRPT